LTNCIDPQSISQIIGLLYVYLEHFHNSARWWWWWRCRCWAW